MMNSCSSSFVNEPRFQRNRFLELNPQRDSVQLETHDLNPPDLAAMHLTTGYIKNMFKGTYFHHFYHIFILSR